MPFALLAFLYRKPGIALEQYIDYYENTHMDVIREVVGSENFPLSHTRRYIHRIDGAGDQQGGPSNLTTPALVLRGKQESVDFDCIVELTFTDEAAWQRFYKALSSPEGAAKINADEAVFQDASKSTLVIRGDCNVTRTRINVGGVIYGGS